MKKIEIWKDIPNYNGIYQVSNFGRVRTHENKTTYTKMHGIRHWKQKILKFKGHTPKTGYRVSLWKDGKQKDFLVARLVAFTFYEKDINNHKLTVNHIDGNRMNNYIENLELITLKENIRHGFDNGLYSNSVKIFLKDKETNEKFEFRSMSKAGEFMGYSNSYISAKMKRFIYENKKYIWSETPF